MHIFKNRWILRATLLGAFAVPLALFAIFQGMDLKDLKVEIPALSNRTFTGNAAWIALSIIFGTIGFLISSCIVWLLSMTKADSRN